MGRGWGATDGGGGGSRCLASGSVRVGFRQLRDTAIRVSEGT